MVVAKAPASAVVYVTTRVPEAPAAMVSGSGVVTAYPSARKVTRSTVRSILPVFRTVYSAVSGSVSGCLPKSSVAAPAMVGLSMRTLPLEVPLTMFSSVMLASTTLSGRSVYVPLVPSRLTPKVAMSPAVPVSGVLSGEYIIIVRRRPSVVAAI